MRVLITGSEGQLGRSLRETAPTGLTLIPTDVASLNLADRADLLAGLTTHRPDIVINAAAYTAVDRAEAEPELAQRINAHAVGDIAGYCLDSGCRLIQISTDFVFAGDIVRPLRPDDPTGPLSVYGRTKLAGETAAQNAGSLCRIVRTSWVYSEHGNNFVKTMLRLGRERDRLTVVDDQTGSPTYARNLALAIWQLARQWPAEPVLHYADRGECTWFEFARAVFAAAQAAGLVDSPPAIDRISTADYGAPAPRPAYSVLDTQSIELALGLQRPHWSDALAQMLSRLAAGNG